MKHSLRSPLRIAALFLSLSLFISGKSQSGGKISQGGFEDSNAVLSNWTFSYGEPFFEDSIHIDGSRSLRVEAEGGHIDLVLDSLRARGNGLYEISFWYRALEGHQEGAPFWVELVQGGRSVEVYRTGSEKARTRNLSRDWILFSADVRISGSKPLKLFIHSDLPLLWLDQLEFQEKG